MQSDGSGHELSGTGIGEVRLDDECAKVFAMDDDPMDRRFDVGNLHDVESPSDTMQYGEKEYSCE